MTMWEILGIIFWCAVGVSSFIWLSWDREAFTWGDLVLCVALGCIAGPLFWVIIAAKVLVGARFWNEPIFGRRKSNAELTGSNK